MATSGSGDAMTTGWRRLRVRGLSASTLSRVAGAASRPARDGERPQAAAWAGPPRLGVERAVVSCRSADFARRADVAPRSVGRSSHRVDPDVRRSIRSRRGGVNAARLGATSRTARRRTHSSPCANFSSKIRLARMYELAQAIVAASLQAAGL